jgi:hypothetical protein
LENPIAAQGLEEAGFLGIELELKCLLHGDSVTPTPRRVHTPPAQHGLHLLDPSPLACLDEERLGQGLPSSPQPMQINIHLRSRSVE